MDEAMHEVLDVARQLRLDANETAVFSRQLEFIKTRTFDIKYPNLKARQFIPTSNEAPNSADTITYRVWDQYGMAKIVANYADDLPLVDVTASETTVPVKSLGDAYQYSVQDLRISAATGANLDTRRASMARRAIEAAIDQIAAKGVPGTTMTGFLNNPNVPIVAPDTGSWSAATDPADIIADLNKLVNYVITTTGQVHTPNTLLFDTASFAMLTTRPMGADFNNTVMKTFLNNNPYITSVDQWTKLDTADADGTGPRLVAYVKDPEVLELEIPQEFEQFPPQARNLTFIVNCHARIGGVSIRYPLAMAYMDGI